MRLGRIGPIAAGAAIVAAAGASAGSALGCGGPGVVVPAAQIATPAQTMATLKREGILHTGSPTPVGSAVSSYLDLPVARIRAELLAGQSLFDIAVAQHKQPPRLVKTIVGVHKLELDAAVSAGKLTAGQEAAKLASLTGKVTAAVNGMVTD
jgi:hypothetical protein